MLKLLLLPCAAALLNTPAFSAQRCTYEEVSELAETEAVEGDVWVKATENAQPALDLTNAMAAATAEPTVIVGAPAAVGRLRPRSTAAPVIDVLRSSIPKEQLERCGPSMDACLEALLGAWVEALGDDEFEALGASATLYTSDAFSRFGFSEIEFPDLTALGRGEPIVTHRARLPAAIVACDARGNTALAEALRQQPPPSGRAEIKPAPTRDPWAGAFKL